MSSKGFHSTSTDFTTGGSAGLSVSLSTCKRHQTRCARHTLVVLVGATALAGEQHAAAGSAYTSAACHSATQATTVISSYMLTTCVHQVARTNS
jgi:hypothetical protein